MASSKGIRAGGAYVELFADDTPLARSMREWQGKLSKWGQSVSAAGRATLAAGAAALAPIALGVGKFVEGGSALDDMANRTGAGVEALSTLGYAAQRTGTDLGTLEAGLIKSQKAVAAAANGSKPAVAALAKLGLNAATLANQAPEDQFRTIAQAVAAIPNPAQRVAAALSIWGKSGAALIPLANDMGELEARARELGIAMSETDVAAADALGDAWDDLKATAGGVANAVGVALAPALTAAAEAATEAVAQVAGWIREHQRAVVIVATLAAGVTVLGAVLFATGTVLGLLSTALAGAMALASGVTAAVGALGAVLAFLTSPIGLVVAALGLALVAFLKFSGIGAQAAEIVADAWAAAADAIAGARADAADLAKRAGGGFNFDPQQIARAATTGIRSGNAFVDVRTREGFSTALKSLRRNDDAKRAADALQRLEDMAGKQLDAEERTADAVEDLAVGEL